MTDTKAQPKREEPYQSPVIRRFIEAQRASRAPLGERTYLRAEKEVSR